MDSINSTIVNVEEEEDELFSSFFDLRTFDRTLLKSVEAQKENAETGESMNDHIDVSDENFDVFGFRFLHVSISIFDFFSHLEN